jgi:hypothetical protein
VGYLFELYSRNFLMPEFWPNAPRVGVCQRGDLGALDLGAVTVRYRAT